MVRVELLCLVFFSCLIDICQGGAFEIFAGSNQTLPPDASPNATPDFDVHPGRCPAIRFDCDSKPIRYYCVSDLVCFRFQKCCLYACNYVCTTSTSGWGSGSTSPGWGSGWRNDAPDEYSIAAAVIPPNATVLMPPANVDPPAYADADGVEA